MKSYRLRLWLHTTLATSLVGGLALLLGWVQLRGLEAERLQERLCLEGRRLAEWSGPDWLRERAHVEQDLMLKLGLAAPEDLWVQVRHQGQVLGQEGRGAPVADAAAWRAETVAGTPPDPRGRCEVAPEMTASPWPARWQRARVVHGGHEVRLSADLSSAMRDVHAASGRLLAVVLPVTAIVLGLLAWLSANLLLRPVRRLATAMAGLSAPDLSQRLASQDFDREFQPLVQAFNTMLRRLERSFVQASRFSADAAHELKTPLTILLGRLELLLAQAPAGEVQGQVLQAMDEVSRLTGITRKLLLLSQADAGQLPLQRVPVSLRPLLEELVDDMGMLDEQARWQVSVPEGLWLDADPLLLRQVLGNLLGNAARYRTGDGPVVVSAAQGEGEAAGQGAGYSAAMVRLSVRNACEPLPLEARSRLFDRFFRGGAALGRTRDGSGLGLSLCLEIAKAHGASVRIAGQRPEEFEVVLDWPGAAPASS